MCPVRNCRRIGPSVAFLVGHFSAVHNKTTFNDNLDGSISKVGTYNKGPGLPSPGIIVSRGPPPPGTAPCAFPETSSSAKRNATSQKKSEQMPYEVRRQSLPISQSPVPLPAPARENTNLTEPVKYLLSFLAPTHEAWDRLDIQYLKGYSRKRDLPRAWIKFHSKGLICPNIYAYSLAYIVGEEVTDEAEKCTAPVMSTARLSDRCIRLPADLPDYVCAEFSKTKSCVGCRYYCFVQRRRNACSWSSGAWSRNAQRESASEAGTDSVDLDRASVSKDSTDGDSPAPQAAEVGLRRSRSFRTGASRQASSGLRYSINFPETSASELNTTHLEMEDWEFAPGRVLNKKEPAQSQFSEHAPFSAETANTAQTSRSQTPTSQAVNLLWYLKTSAST
jgi:hypothetical protein